MSAVFTNQPEGRAGGSRQDLPHPLPVRLLSPSEAPALPKMMPGSYFAGILHTP